MSKGPGHVQRAILELIAAEPDGAWQTSEICRRVYGLQGRAQRVAVTRALRTIKLPGTWEVYSSRKRSGENWLCNPYNDESMMSREAAEYNHLSADHRKRVLMNTAVARRYRDSTPAGRLAIDRNRYRAGKKRLTFVLYASGANSDA